MNTVVRTISLSEESDIEIAVSKPMKEKRKKKGKRKKKKTIVNINVYTHSQPDTERVNYITPVEAYQPTINRDREVHQAMLRWSRN